MTNTIKMKDLPTVESSEVTELIGLDKNGQSVKMPNRQNANDSNINVTDNLISNSSTDALSANQGRILNEALMDKMPLRQEFATINGQSVLGKRDIIVGTGEFPTRTKMVIDIQPSVGKGNQGGYGVWVDINLKANVAYYTSCVNTIMSFNTSSEPELKAATGQFKVRYADNTESTWIHKWNGTNDRYYEYEFTPLKDVIAIQYATYNQFYMYHYEETVLEVSPWNGKRWLVFGDSISVDKQHLNGKWADLTYPYIIGDELGILIFNTAQGGKMVRYFFPLPQLLTDGNFDIISIELGANNHIFHVPLGTLHDDIYQQCKDDISLYNARNSSTYAEFCLFYEELRKYFPSQPVLFLSTLKRTDPENDSNNDIHGDMKNSMGLTLAAYSECIKNVAGNYGCPFVDIYNCCTPKNLVERTLWYIEPNEGTHPNSNAHKYRISPIIENAFREIRPL